MQTESFETTDRTEPEPDLRREEHPAREAVLKMFGVRLKEPDPPPPPPPPPELS